MTATSDRQRLSRFVAAALTAGALACAGCGPSDDTEATLDAASVILSTASASPFAAGEAEPARDAALDQAVSRLTPVQAGDDASAKAAAGMLKGVAQQGLAADEAVRASTAFRATETLRAAIRSAADLWTQEHARAAARLAFDPGPQSGELRRQIAELQSEQAELTEQLEQARAEAQGLETEIADLSGKSRALRDRAAEIRLSLVGRSETEAANRAPEIRDITRQADQLDTAAARLQARLDRGVRLEIADLDARVSQRKGRTALIEDGLREIDRQRGAAEEIAVRHRAAAAAEEQKIIEAVAALRAVVADTVVPAFEDAIASASTAASSARGGATISAAGERTAMANAGRRKGSVELALSATHAELAALFAHLAETDPPLAARADHAAAAADHARLAQERREAAAESFESAAQSLLASSPRGLDREALERASAELEALAARLRGTTPEEPQPESQDPSDGAVPPEAAPAPDADPQSP